MEIRALSRQIFGVSGYTFQDGDKFYYDILDDDQSLDDRCEKCAKDISFMDYSIIGEINNGS